MKPGQELFGYRVLEFVGEGAWAYVYKAQHPKLPMHVAIKQLKPEWAEDEHALQRFLREADIVAQINHPNVVRIFDLKYDEDIGSHYIITEFAEKGTLADRLEKSPEGLPVDEVLHIALGLCSGLEVAHRRGIVHRDVTPDNILLFDVGEDRDIPKLCDFGIARASSFADVTALSSSGVVDTSRSGALGTRYYMSPEHWNEDTEIDQRADLYSLGIVIYEMLTGQPPFAGEPLEVFLAHSYEAPPPPSRLRPDVPEALEEIVLRVLRKDRVDRYQSAADMYKALEAVVDTSVRRERQREFRALREQGLAYLAQGEWERAIEMLRQADVLAQGDDQVQVGLQKAREQLELKRLYDAGVEYLGLGDWEDAQDYLAQVLAYDPDYAGGRAREQLEQATQALKRERRRRDLTVLYRRGMGHFRRWRWAQAIAQLQQVVAEDSEFEDAADRLVEARRYAQADSLFEQAQAHIEQEEWEEAVDLLEEVVRLSPPHIDPTRELESARARWAEARAAQQLLAWYGEGVAQLVAGSLEQAKASFERVRERRPDYPGVADRLKEIETKLHIERLFGRAFEHEAAGEWESVIEVCRAILVIDPLDREASRCLARAQRRADWRDRGGLAGATARVQSWWDQKNRHARIIYLVLLGVIVLGLCVGGAMAAGVSFLPMTKPSPTATISVPAVLTATTARVTPAPTNTLPPTPKPTSTDIPSSASAPTTIPTWTPSPTACVPDIELVAQLTVPDRTTWSPSMYFTVTWVLKNASPCPWPEGSRLIFIGGAQMGGPDEQEMQLLPTAAETITVSVPFIAPESEGQHESVWQIQDAGGEPISEEFRLNVVVSGPSISKPTYYPPPELVKVDVIGCDVVLQWTWTGELDTDEYFAVRAGIGSPGESRIWTKDTQYICSFKQEEAGDYAWEVAICRGDPGAHVCEQLAVSEQGAFSFRGCGGPPY